jgi:hypothetical protein
MSGAETSPPSIVFDAGATLEVTVTGPEEAGVTRLAPDNSSFE